MDNLTHALVGAAIGKAGAERLTPLATGTLVIAANAPDVDVFSYVKGEYFALSFRRGITHGWPALLLLPLVVAAVVLGWDRWIRRRRSPESAPARAGPILALSYLGAATHPTLDWMNTYGMRWGLPFDGSWTYGDALFIIDPWIWLALGGAVFLASAPDRLGMVAWALLTALASLAILAFPLPLGVKTAWIAGLAAIAVLRVRRGPQPPASTPARTAAVLGAVAGYVVLMVGADLLARGEVRAAAEAAGLQVRDVMVAPQPATPLSAEVEVLTERGYVPGTHRWLGSPRVRLDPDDVVPLLAGPPDLAPERLEAIAAAGRADPDVSLYLVWSRFPYTLITRESGGWRVTFSDARYDGAPGAGGLSGITVTVASEDLE